MATLTFSIRIQPLLAKALRHVSIAASSWPYKVSAYRGSIQRRVWPPDLSSSTADFKSIPRSLSRFGALNCSATQCTSKFVHPNQARQPPRPPSPATRPVPAAIAASGGVIIRSPDNFHRGGITLAVREGFRDSPHATKPHNLLA